MARMRGARPTPRHKLAAMMPFRPAFGAPAPPSSFGTVPTSGLGMYGNDVDGDCVTAERAASMTAFSIWGQVATPKITFSDQSVIQWARQHGVLNGADLGPVCDQMMTDGLTATNGAVYTDGPHQAVDWTNWASLSAALVQGPVKYGIAADQLENAVNSTNGKSGWLATGFQQDGNEDHSIGIWGYGTFEDCVKLLQSAGIAVDVPASQSLTVPANLGFTWDSVGIFDAPSLVAITGEAMITIPTIVQPIPGPSPSPVPSPTPAPTPPPAPSTTVSVAGSFTIANGVVVSFATGAGK